MCRAYAIDFGPAGAMYQDRIDTFASPTYVPTTLSYDAKFSPYQAT